MTDLTDFQQKLSAFLPDMKLCFKEPMAKHTSFRIGGAAEAMAFPKDKEELAQLLKTSRLLDCNPAILGAGTNVLAPDEGMAGLVICLKDCLDGMERLDETHIRVMAGVTMTRAAMFAAKQGLSGLEFAHGIPGTVGGAVCMNAGAYDGEMKQVVESVTVLFPEEGVRTLTGAEMDFGYRHSLLSDRPEAVVLSAVFRLTPGDRETIREKMRDLMARRKASQPLEWPSAGSTFKRPTGYFAGTLIDQCGLKGLTVGGAQVSEKHAGFVINTGGATCADVKELIRQVQERVLAEKGVRLETEVKIIG